MMYLLQLLLIMMVCLLYSKADTVTDSRGYNDSFYYSIDQASSTMSTYIDTETSVKHIELDSYNPGNLLFSDGSSLKTTDGYTTQTVAGHATSDGYREGVGGASRFFFIQGFTQTSSRNVVLVDFFNQCLRALDRLTLQTEAFAGVCGIPGYADGLQSLFHYPNKVIPDNQNREKLFVTDRNNKAVRHVDLTTRDVSTVFRDTGLSDLLGITQDNQSGNLYLTSSSAVYQLTYLDKILTLLAGHPTQHGYQDGTFSDSRLSFPLELLLIDNNKKFLVADALNNKLRVLDRVSNTTGSICTGAFGHTDGDINSCSLDFPLSLLVTEDYVYIGVNGSIRKLSGTYVITPCEATDYRKSSRVCEHCDCTSLSQSDQCDNTGQCPCETSDGENQELAGRQCNWYIEKIFPLYGPVAGGTKVSITGGYFSQGQLKASLDGVPLNLTVSWNSASFISEPYPDKTTKPQVLTVSLIAQNRTVGPEDFEFGFEYRPNPIIEGIQSRKTFLSGGLSLNVTGQYMDSVAVPQMIVYIKQYGKIVSTATSVCNVLDSTTISCPTPNVKEATDAVLNNQSIVHEAENPGRRSINGRSGLGYTPGFRYDGYEYDMFDDLKNHQNPKLRETSFLQVFDDPEIYRFVETEVDDDVVEFDPKKDKSIQIAGRGLDWDPDQWVVEIGKERCRVTSVFNDRIICVPPMKMPEMDAAVDYKEHKGKQIPHIVVRIGNIRPTVIGFIYYKSSLWEDSVAFRVCMIALTIIAILVFIVILFCHLRRKWNTDQTENNSNQLSDGAMNLRPVGGYGARSGDYVLADEHQLAGPSGGEYESIESVQRANQNLDIPEESAATKKSPSIPACKGTGLVEKENDLYNS